MMRYMFFKKNLLLNYVGNFQANKKWLGREDSNLRMQEPKSCVLPLDDAPEWKMQDT
jgi:hypothetical protein